MICSANWLVLAFPPRSPVMKLPSAMVCDGSAIWRVSREEEEEEERKGGTHGEGRLLDLGGVLVETHVPKHCEGAREKRQLPERGQSGREGVKDELIMLERIRAVGLALPCPCFRYARVSGESKGKGSRRKEGDEQRYRVHCRGRPRRSRRPCQCSRRE